MKVFGIIILFLLNTPTFAGKSSLNLDAYVNAKWKLSKTQKKYLLEGKVLAEADVETINKTQSFELKVFAYHSTKCRKALRKISRFENYKDWINFITYSHYRKKSHLLTFKANHPLLPYPMIIYIITERPTKPGRYTFTFPTGLFGGLKGYYEITEFNNRCMFFARSNWIGPKTKLPDFAVELFSETLSRLGGEILMRKSR